MVYGEVWGRLVCDVKFEFKTKDGKLSTNFTAKSK